MEKDNVNIVSIIDAETFQYKDAEKIRKAVFEALKRINVDGLIKPGMTVLIKPNLVMDNNHHNNGGTDCLYTQPEVIDPVVEYVCIHLNGSGRIIIGDAPMQQCVFERIKGLKEIQRKYEGKVDSIEVVDFRELTTNIENGIQKKTINPNADGTIINLGKNSEFFGESDTTLSKMRVTDYDPRIMPKHHMGDIQEYYVSNYVLQSDVIINMPKPKTHRKAGVTISLKNFVGINTRKEFLPHHTFGSSKDGGDEYLKKNWLHSIRSKLFDIKNILEAEKKYFSVRIIRFFILGISVILKYSNNPYSEGSWYGNKTISRTISDLNTIVRFVDKKGNLCLTPQRNVIILADMIVSGEEEGPVAPSPKNVGIVAAGSNPVCFDEVISTLMGFDYQKIPSIVRARQKSGNHRLVEEGIKPIISSNIQEYDNATVEELRQHALLCFKPTKGWKGHIELE